jgi:molecular chaperone DnaK (HSP70)
MNSRIKITREEFEDMTKDLLDKTMSFIDRILSKANLDESKIDKLLLVGGSSFMPMVQNTVKARFGEEKVIQHDPNLAVAKGAALYAAMTVQVKIDEAKEEGKSDAEIATDLGTTVEDVKKSHVTPLGTKQQIIKVDPTASRSFGPGILYNGEYRVNNLIFMLSKLPAEKSQTYYTQADNQPLVELNIFENFAEAPKDENDPDREKKEFVVPCEDIDGNEQPSEPELKVKKIGTLELPLPAGTPKGSEIEVTFRLEPLGLYVKAVNPKTGESIDATLKSETTLTDEELEATKKTLKAVSTSSEVQ